MRKGREHTNNAKERGRSQGEGERKGGFLATAAAVHSKSIMQKCVCVCSLVWSGVTKSVFFPFACPFDQSLKDPLLVPSASSPFPLLSLLFHPPPPPTPTSAFPLSLLTQVPESTKASIPTCVIPLGHSFSACSRCWRRQYTLFLFLLSFSLTKEWRANANLLAHSSGLISSNSQRNQQGTQKASTETTRTHTSHNHGYCTGILAQGRGGD